jgi:hypothetical protein
MTKSNRLHVAAAFLAAFSLALFASAPGYAEIHCAGGHCNCSGDKDCNEMFEHHCSATGGSCNNDNNTCVCTEKATASTGNPTRKHPVLTAPVNKKGQSMSHQ